MVQKTNPHPAPGCDRSPPYYVFSKDAILGSVPSISSEVLVLTLSQVQVVLEVGFCDPVMNFRPDKTTKLGCWQISDL